MDHDHPMTTTETAEKLERDKHDLGSLIAHHVQQSIPDDSDMRRTISTRQ